MEGGNFQIQTVHPVTDFSDRIFRANKDNSLQRHLRQGHQICQHIRAAHEADEGAVAAELVKGMDFEMVCVDMGEKNQAYFLDVGLQPVPRNTTVEKEAAVQKNGIASLTARGDNLTGH
jgi:hypothetical protein